MNKINKSMAYIFIFFVLFFDIFICKFCDFAFAQVIERKELSIHFAWNPNTEDDLAGYRLYKHDSDIIIQEIPAGTESVTITHTAIEGVEDCWELTAFDFVGNESLRSEPLCKTWQWPPEPPEGIEMSIGEIISEMLNLIGKLIEKLSLNEGMS